MILIMFLSRNGRRHNGQTDLHRHRQHPPRQRPRGPLWADDAGATGPAQGELPGEVSEESQEE